MKHTARLLTLAVTSLALGLPATAAQADPGIASHMKVDGYIGTCRFTDASTSANLPDPLVIEADTVNPPVGNLSCGDGSPPPHLDNDPGVIFGPNADTATVDRVVATATRSTISCTYEATNIGLTRDQATGWFNGSTVTARRIAGSIFFCPPSASMGPFGLFFY